MEIPFLRFEHGETIDMLRASVRDFAVKEIEPRAAEIDQSNAFPMDLWPKLGALGQKAITGVDGPCTRAFGYIQDFINHQIAFTCRGWADVICFLGITHMRRIPIGI